MCRVKRSIYVHRNRLQLRLWLLGLISRVALATICPVPLLLIFYRGFVSLVYSVAGEVLVICWRLGIEFFQNFSLLGGGIEVYLRLVKAYCEYSIVHVVAIEYIFDLCLLTNPLRSCLFFLIRLCLLIRSALQPTVLSAGDPAA